MENSRIEWTDHTFNPWIGCTKVSDGCKHCYAETLMDKRYGKVEWGPQGQRIRTSAANWRKPLKWNREAAAAGKRARVFCASLADVFEDKPDQPEMDKWRVELFQLIQDTPSLDWMLLTKRPENVMEMVKAAGAEWYYELPNVWIGTSVENQEQADKRIPALLTIPAAVRFLSMEPLLGAVSLDNGETSWLTCNGNCTDESEDVCQSFEYTDKCFHGIDWVIVGGESGPNARPMYPAWALNIRDQCQAAGVPFFFKQWGEWLPTEDVWGNHFDFRKVGKHAAGRLLDGREWDEFPPAADFQEEDMRPSSDKYGRIICPECGREQNAQVLETSLWNIYVHTCERCGYVIMESEWETVDDEEEE